MTPSMCAATTVRVLVGTKPLSNKRQAAFEPVDGPVNDRIDDAYRVKYRGSPYLDPMIGNRARSATVRIIPQISNS